MTMSVQIKKKRKPSQALLELVEGLAPDFQKLQDKVDEVFRKGREEGFNDMQIGNLVRSRMKEHYSPATIRNVLPETAKHMEKRNKYALKNTASDHEDEDEDSTIWQFNAEEFSIQNLEQYDKVYLRTAVEHFYADSRKWKKKYEDLVKIKTKTAKKAKSEDWESKKSNLLMKGLAFSQSQREMREDE
jgi:hypothetical protein